MKETAFIFTLQIGFQTDSGSGNNAAINKIDTILCFSTQGSILKYWCHLWNLFFFFFPPCSHFLVRFSFQLIWGYETSFWLRWKFMWKHNSALFKVAATFIQGLIKKFGLNSYKPVSCSIKWSIWEDQPIFFGEKRYFENSVLKL